MLFHQTRHSQRNEANGDSTGSIVIATSIPVENRQDVSLAWFLEADYHLPENVSDIRLPIIDSANSRHSRNLDRRRVYGMIEIMLERFGLSGRSCLLKAICEAAEIPLHLSEQNGLLGDLLHIILTGVEQEKRAAAVYVKRQWKNRIHSYCFINERILTIRIRIDKGYMTIIAVYAPEEGKEKE
ncbi:hypothetical protein C0J52_05210 [Blattella germanica]|nr:hypothetical protein C0J52_05210 [Blattella germanica]